MNSKFKSIVALAVLACAASASSAASLGSWGSSTNTSDITQAFEFGGVGNETVTLDLTAGSYDLDFAAFEQITLWGKMNSVMLNVSGFLPETLTKDGPGAFSDFNDKFTLLDAGTLSFTFDTSKTKVPFGKLSPAYLGLFQLTEFGVPDGGGTGGGVPAVPEPTNVALMLAGLAGVGFVARRRKQSNFS